MKRGILLLLIFSTLTTIKAQQQVLFKQWDKRFGGTSSDVCASILVTADGDFIVGGGSQSGISGDKTQDNWDTTHQYGDYWILKIDSFGIKQWDKRFGAISQDNLSMVRKTFDGGYILGGSSGSGLVSGDKTEQGRGNWDYWMVKTDSIGNKQWDKRFGGSSIDFLWDIRETRDSGFIMGGYSNSPNNGDKSQDDWDPAHFYYDFWVVKTDPLGNKLWDKRYGGTGDEMLFSLLQTPNGGYLLGGYSKSPISGDKTVSNWGLSAFWIVKIDSLGNKEWDKAFGGTDGEILKSLIAVNDGYVLGGYSYSGIGGDKTQANWSGDPDYWVVKIDTSGNKQWDKVYGGFGEDELYSLVQTNDGGYLLSGCSFSFNAGGNKSEHNLSDRQTWVVKTDSLGNQQWDKTMFTTGSPNFGYAIQSRDGCYAVANYTEGGIAGYKTQPNWDTLNQTYDYWIVKFCVDTPTAITELTNQPQINIYPNPFTSDISISLQKQNLSASAKAMAGKTTFTITNTIGQIIYTKQETNLSSSYTKMLDLSYLPNGVYFVEVVVDGERMVRQIVKQ